MWRARTRQLCPPCARELQPTSSRNHAHTPRSDQLHYPTERYIPTRTRGWFRVSRCPKRPRDSHLLLTSNIGTRQDKTRHLTLTCTTTHVSAGRRSSAPKATRRGPPDREDPLPPPPPPAAAAAAAAASSNSLCLNIGKQAGMGRESQVLTI